MSIRVDVSRSSIVVWCQTCRVWSVLASSRRHAWALGADHESRCHGERTATTKVQAALMARRDRDTPKT